LRLGSNWHKVVESRYPALLDLIRASDRRQTVARLPRRYPNGTSGFGQAQGWSPALKAKKDQNESAGRSPAALPKKAYERP
jgi:hypothetical protein